MQTSDNSLERPGSRGKGKSQSQFPVVGLQGLFMKTLNHGSFVVRSEDLKVRHADASCSVLLVLYDRGAKNVAVYKRISGGDAEIKTRGEKFGFLGKHSEIVVLTQDQYRFFIAVGGTADDGQVQYHLVGERGDQPGISAILVYNRDKKPVFHLRGIVEEDSARRYMAFPRKFEGNDIYYLDEFLEPLLAALPERFDLELFINQAIGRTGEFVREMRHRYD